MKLLNKLKSTSIQAVNNALVDCQIPPWHSALSSIGWPAPLLDTITTIRTARGPGFLASRYPNVVTVLKAGPSHPAAGQVVGVLERIAHPTGQGGTHGRSGGVAVPDSAVRLSRWKTLADYDDAMQLRAKLISLLNNSHAAHYAAPQVQVFDRCFASGNIAKLREAYCSFVEKWLSVRRLGYGG